jgi:hypothetical protein
MKFVSSLMLVMVHVVLLPSDHPEVKRFFLPDGEEYEIIRDIFLASQRATVYIEYDRVLNLNMDVRWFRSNENLENTRLLLIFASDGEMIQASWTHHCSPATL